MDQLVSGSVGQGVFLNSCIFYLRWVTNDSQNQDFNPQNDKQAEDRCHRIGQTRYGRCEWADGWAMEFMCICGLGFMWCAVCAVWWVGGGVC